MHIAFLTPEYPHEKASHAAGIGTSIKNLVLALRQKGISVSVFAYSQKKNEIFWEDGVKIHLIAHRNYPMFGWYLYRKQIQNYLSSYIKEDSIDLLETPDWTGITAFMKFKIPVVMRFHGSDAYFCQLENRKQKFKNFWFEKMAVNNATAYIAPTKFAGEVSQKIFNIQNKTIRTIHYGLELSKFQNPNPNEYQKGLILYIGTIIRKKGVLELPEIFKRVKTQYPDAKLILIGGDAADYETKSPSTWVLLEREIQEKNLDGISYLGKIPYDEVQQYMRQAHICVFPTFAETLGMVTIESMALQKPVVNSNIGWARELIVEGESGYLVYPKDHELFADKILGLLEDEKLCLEMGSTARIRVERLFDIEKLAGDNIIFYKSIMAQF